MALGTCQDRVVRRIVNYNKIVGDRPVVLATFRDPERD